MREIFGRSKPQAESIELQNAESIHSASDIHNADTERDVHNNHNIGATPDCITQATPTQGFDSDDDIINKDSQAGVQKMEATTKVWSKKHLIAAYIM